MLPLDESGRNTSPIIKRRRYSQLGMSGLHDMLCFLMNKNERCTTNKVLDSNSMSRMLISWLTPLICPVVRLPMCNSCFQAGGEVRIGKKKVCGHVPVMLSVPRLPASST